MVVLVTGMHRSGTSALAELLIEGGFNGGGAEAMMPASSVNERGFFERLDVADINDRLLRAVNAHWLAPPSETAALQSLAEGPMGVEARLIVEHLETPGREAVLKDPRFCLTLPFWQAVLGEQLRGVVLVFRNPSEVAASLRERDGLVEPISTHLWVAYYLAALSALDGIHLFPVEYSDLLNDPGKALEVIGDAFLGVFSVEKAIRARTLDQRLRHHHAPSTDSKTHQVTELLDHLRALRGGVGQGAPAISVDAPFDMALSVASAVDRASRREMEVVIAERDEARSAFQASRREIDEARSAFQASRREMEVVIAERDEARSAFQASRREVEVLIAERDEARSAFQAKIRKERETAEATRASLQQELDSVHGVVLESTARLERERDDAREAHRLTGQQLAVVRRSLADYEGSRAAGFARRLWATKRKIRAAKARFLLGSPGSQGQVDHEEEEIVDAATLPPVSLPTVDEPLVSIVIPVYGQLKMTAGCLRSIEHATKHVPYEVIVVDDCSPDDSSVWLERCSNVRVVSNSTNLGFLHSTNAGVAAATGRYVCLLNNDTEVHPGWLTALLRGFADGDDVGAVGAKLVYPDGTLQEGGGIVFSDASGWNFGRTGDPEAPEVNFLREVDYCSAACLLVRRDFWDGLGGFDERFAPAYYEDTDLAFALRDSGRRVLYQPAAVVSHFEGVSHGTDETKGLKAYQIRNQATFQNKWSETLSKQPAPGSSPRLASWRAVGRRVLVIDHEVPAADQDSGSVRMSAILELLLENGFKVSLLPQNRFRREPYCSELQAKGIEVLYGGYDVESLLLDIRSDLAFAVVSRPAVAEEFIPLLRRLVPEVPVVYDMVDFHGLRLQRRSETRADLSDLKEAQRVSEMEQEFARTSDHVLAITTDEAELMRELETTAKISVLPNIHRSPRSKAPFDDRNGVLFIGSYRHVPNQDAIEWMLNDILPRIWEKDDKIIFHLVGSDLPENLLALDDPRIVVHGWLPHLDDVFDRVRLTVAPLRFGAGLKGKVGDSLARGVPCVSTDVGAEGFGSVADVLLIANSAQELADLVVGAHNDGDDWIERAGDGAHLIDQHFGYEAARNALRDVLAELGVASSDAHES